MSKCVLQDMSGEKNDPGGRNEMAALSVMFSPAVENENREVGCGERSEHM